MGKWLVWGTVKLMMLEFQQKHFINCRDGHLLLNLEALFPFLNKLFTRAIKEVNL